ncbi:MAG: biopolymer transporter Tol, partial [Bacteroidota bacterium]|nr:biopolymer transporter Tol [Bacteroidota bacterium]
MIDRKRNSEFRIQKNFLNLKIPVLALLSFIFITMVQSQENHYNHGELNWHTLETEHFFVHYHNGEERTARTIAKIAEDIYGPVTSLYQHQPDQKVSFIIKDYDDYSNGAAYFYDNRIEIWAPALDFDLRGTHNWLRNVITHEFTHIIQIQTSMKFGRRFPGFYLQWLNYEEERRQDVLYGYPNTVVSYPISGFVIPSWFAEGVAQYNRPEMSYDYWDSHRDMILRMYALDGNMLSWSEMSVFGKTSLGNESSYNAGFALTKYISEKYGQDAIPAIAKNLSRTNMVTIDQAIERSIGKSGKDLYAEWKNHLTEDYHRRVEAILTNKIEGETIASEGFGNFYPSISPDGKKIAYTSNKQADYFGLSSLYVYDIETKKEEMIVAPVRSSLAWSPDGKKIYYSKITHENPNGSQISDLYVVDLDSKKETRLTYGWRAINPSLSSDGKHLCFAVGGDGTMNLAISDTLGKNYRRLTNYKNGEQVYLPKWSPNDTTIAFGFSYREEQDVATISMYDSTAEMVLTGTPDDRNPVFSSDGKYLYFVSDRTGIFNVYRMEISSKSIEQVTNVLGGTFMPSVDEKGRIAFSFYTSTGFKINYLTDPAGKDLSLSHYLKSDRIRQPEVKVDDTTSARNKFDWTSLRSYDDTKVFGGESRTYKNIFTSLSIIPFLRFDNYNTKSKGLDFLKPGLYFLSSDVIDKMNLFGGAAINHIFERDLFLIFEYRDRVIGLHQLGLDPTISFEIYNITRKRTDEKLVIVEKFEESQADITYSLLEFDLFFKQHLFSELDILSAGVSHSIYSTSVSAFIIQSSKLLVPASSDNYFKGTMLSLDWKVNAIVPSRTSEINPIGATLLLRYEYNIDRFNSDGKYEVSETGVNPVLNPFNFHRGEVR